MKLNRLQIAFWISLFATAVLWFVDILQGHPPNFGYHWIPEAVAVSLSVYGVSRNSNAKVLVYIFSVILLYPITVGFLLGGWNEIVNAICLFSSASLVAWAIGTRSLIVGNV